MISAIIGLVVSLAVLYIVYLLLQWILGVSGIVPGVFQTIVYIIFAVIAFVVILNFLGAFLGGTWVPQLRWN